MRNSHLGGALLYCVLQGASSFAAPEELTPNGVWLHNNKRIGVEVAPCGGELCGRIVWLKSPNDDSGRPRTDSKNPDPALRGRPIVGLTVIRGLVRGEGRNWTDGTIYNPEDGNAYRARITIEDPDTLKVHAYNLLPVFGKTLIWTRLRHSDRVEKISRR